MKLSETGKGSEAVRQEQQQCGNSNQEAVMQTGDGGREQKVGSLRKDEIEWVILYKDTNGDWRLEIRA
jgi:hypothetical protein